MVAEGLTIIGVVWLLYGRAIGWELVVDDTKMRKFIDSGRKVNRFERIKYSLTFHNKNIDRILSISIHATVCLLIYITLGGDEIAWWTAILFAVHPISLSVAVWLNGKRYGWNTIIVLLVYGFAPFTLPLLIFVPRLQASAIPTPLLFLRTHPLYIIFAMLMLLPFRKKFMKWWSSRKKRVLGCSIKWYSERIVLIIRTLFYYLTNGITARKVGMYHELLDGIFEDEFGERTKKWMTADDGVVWKTAVLIGLFGLMMAVWNTRLGEGLWWWFIFSVVFSNWTTVTQSITDRYCYLPIIGLLLFIVVLLERMSGGWWELILLGWVGWLLIRNIQGARAYKDLDNFVDYHFKEMPEASRVWIVKANYDKDNGRIKEAVTCCVEGLRRFRWCGKLYLTGIVILSKVEYAEACELLTKKDVDKLILKLEGMHERT